MRRLRLELDKSGIGGSLAARPEIRKYQPQGHTQVHYERNRSRVEYRCDLPVVTEACLFRLWRDWRSALAIVKPETVVAWHRAGFRRGFRKLDLPSKFLRITVD
jgi:hypothetical protein